MPNTPNIPPMPGPGPLGDPGARNRTAPPYEQQQWGPPYPGAKVNRNNNPNQFGRLSRAIEDRGPKLRSAAVNLLDAADMAHAFSRPGGMLRAIRYTLTGSPISGRAKRIYSAEALERGSLYGGGGDTD